MKYSSEPQTSKFIFLEILIFPGVYAQRQAYSLNGFDLSKIIFYFYFSNQFWPITFDRVPVAIVTVLSWHLTKDGIWINPKHGGTAYSQRSEHTSGVPMLFFILDDPITTLSSYLNQLVPEEE